jgi:hypothetical protein
VNLMTALPTPELAQALWIADGVMSGAVKDNSHGATHYLTTALLAGASAIVGEESAGAVDDRRARVSQRGVEQRRPAEVCAGGNVACLPVRWEPSAFVT